MSSSTKKTEDDSFVVTVLFVAAVFCVLFWIMQRRKSSNKSQSDFVDKLMRNLFASEDESFQDSYVESPTNLEYHITPENHRRQVATAMKWRSRQPAKALAQRPIFDESMNLFMTPEYQPYHNCMMYALNLLEDDLRRKPQPGYKQNLEPLSEDEYTCPNFKKRMLGDWKDMFEAPDDTGDPDNGYICPEGYHAISLHLDNEGKDQDYHWLRQDNGGTWSHKPGAGRVTNLDAGGKIIVNPKHANLNYNTYNYNNHCGYFCTKTNRSASK